MLRRHVPLALRCKVRVGAEGDDGSGIRLGMAAGAATLHMDKASISLPVTQPWCLKRGVLVNAQGQRFINEDAYFGWIGEAALFHQGGRAWLIVDDEVFEQPDYVKRVADAGETPEELERELGLPEGSLAATLAVYNRHAERGLDPVFGKQADYLKPLTVPPFGAIDCTTEKAIYAAFVYQYATSIVASTSLARGILAEASAAEPATKARDAYLAMLSAGSSKYAIDLLKDAGVDMTTSAPFSAAMAEMNKVMDDMEALLKK